VSQELLPHPGEVEKELPKVKQSHQSVINQPGSKFLTN
jgi:hypothetical protein